MRTEGICNYHGEPMVRVLDNHDRTLTYLTLRQARELVSDIQAAIEEAELEASALDARIAAREAAE